MKFRTIVTAVLAAGLICVGSTSSARANSLLDRIWYGYDAGCGAKAKCGAEPKCSAKSTKCYRLHLHNRGCGQKAEPKSKAQPQQKQPRQKQPRQKCGAEPKSKAQPQQKQPRQTCGAEPKSKHTPRQKVHRGKCGAEPKSGK